MKRLLCIPSLSRGVLLAGVAAWALISPAVIANAQTGTDAVELAAPESAFQDTGTLMINVDGTNKTVRYYPIDGMAVIEGDIVLGTVEEVSVINMLAGVDFDRIESRTQNSDQRDSLSTLGLDRRFFDRVLPRALAIKATFGGRPRRWPNATVPYEIDPSLTNPGRVTQAIEHWQSKTPVRLVPRDPSNPRHANHVFFMGSPGGGACSSSVGMVGGRQNIRIDAPCSLGNVIHEIGHAVGLAHEQSRSDRDNFVEIVWANIVESAKPNFEINTRRNDDINEYDYGSLMHYPRRGFAIDASRDTVRPLRSGVQIGQRGGLSSGDIRAVERLYAN